MFTQENRLIEIETPLGPNVLLLREFSGTESVSRLFSYRLTLLSENHHISFADIIGKNVTLSITLDRGEKRFINGIVSTFSQSSSGTERIETGTFSQYTATLVPWSWLLTRTSDIRIFQKLSAPDIIKKIFQEKGFSDYSLRLYGSYEKKEYCVQYRETDFNFVSRLMEEEGIYYFFEHESGKHTLILADDNAAFPPCPDQETARYRETEGAFLDEDVIGVLEVKQEIRVGKFTLNDYNFQKPTANLKADAPSRVKLGPGEREIYDYPADYEKWDQGDRLAKIFMESEEAQITSIAGSSNCRAFRTGYRFELQDYFRDDMNDKSYVLMEISHKATSNVAGTGNKETATYSNRFSCIPHETPFRPPRTTSKPVVKGVQTAVVVGPSGEEIYPDKYGRVKVQFHWDREGNNDENSSCWIRVSQAWAGKNWGGLYIPRIHQEVIVEFLEGDPDRPIITGCVYNDNQMPPYALPTEKTKSTIKSNSSKGGGGFNEIRFEDKKGNEEIFLHGQKDWTIAILNDKNQTIGHDETMMVVNNRTRTVGVNQTETIGANMAITVGKNKIETVMINDTETIGVAKELTIGGAYQVSVGAAMNETVGGIKAEEVGAHKTVLVAKNANEDIGGSMTVGVGKDFTEKIGGKHTEQVSKEYILKAKKIQITADDEIVIKTGSSEIIMKKNGDITIKGGKINVKSSGDIIMKGSSIKEN
jgi:type VI secretion system secreted protein VgrG